MSEAKGQIHPFFKEGRHPVVCTTKSKRVESGNFRFSKERQDVTSPMRFVLLRILLTLLGLVHIGYRLEIQTTPKFDLCIYRISANSFCGNYSLLNLALCNVTFDHST